ncbi:MAG: MgtC/SapB family protein [Chitinophagaceae bacterium]|nr:MgtC/SapB family protein [Chitinophagaceae bacterium]
MLPYQEIIIRILLASFLGALIGLERERKHCAAGLRTHMMVCVGSCLIMMVSAFGFKDILGTPNVTLDPSRIAAQVVSGIGFIGAGTILLLKQGTIRGLTTASGLWTVAAIGLATGGGMYFAAVFVTIIAIIILWALKPLELNYFKKKNKTLRIITSLNEENKQLLNKLISTSIITNLQFEKIEDEYIYILEFENDHSEEIEKIINQIKNFPFIKQVSWS